MKTHYEKVCDFNKAFDYKQYNIHEGNAITMYKKEAKYRYDLIHEEGVVELGMAIRTDNRIETMDAIADLLYVLYGACYTYDLDPNIMINNIYSSFDDMYNSNLELTTEKYFEILMDDINEIKECLCGTNNYIIQLYSILVKAIINTYQLGLSLNIDVNHIFDLVHNSNMSKLCNNEEEAIMTVNYYNNKYLKHVEHYEKYCNEYGMESDIAKSVYSPYDSAYYYKSGDYYLVKNKSTGKALKSIHYHPVNLN
jgi:predicted HAD superfamily Cof-like phosphohydrolase